MSNIIALIFDFDITLSPEFQQQVLFEHWGVDANTFWGESVGNWPNEAMTWNIHICAI